ncbi:MAG: hypothetical protein ACHQAX_00595 [Gammaproteobacteria bacterium]
MYILKGIKNGAGAVISAAVSTVSAVGTSIAHYAPTPVTNAASTAAAAVNSVTVNALYALGYVPASEVEELRKNIDKNMTVEEAFIIARKFGIHDYIKAQEYYEIVLTSTKTDHALLQFQARCHLACMIAQLPLEDIHTSKDDAHGLLLNKAKSVNNLLVAAYMQDPSACSYQQADEDYGVMLALSFNLLKEMIKQGLQEFVEKHQTCSFDKYTVINARWENWKMILDSFNLTSKWWRQHFTKEAASPELELPDPILRQALSNLFLLEIKRLNDLYRSKTSQHEFNLDSFYNELHALGDKINAVPVLVTAEPVKAAYADLMGDVAKEMAMNLYAQLNKKTEAAQQGEEARSTLMRVRDFLMEANGCKNLDVNAADALKDVLRKIMSLDMQYASNHKAEYLAQCENELGNLSLYLTRKENPEEVLEQIAWLNNKKEILESIGVGECKREADALLATLKTHLASKELFFAERVNIAVGNMSEALIASSLGDKKIACTGGFTSTVAFRDPADARFPQSNKEHLKEVLTSIFSDMDVAKPFYAAPAAERTERETKVKQLLTGLYSYSPLKNLISLREIELSEAAKNTIKSICKGPVVHQSRPPKNP